MERNKDEKNFNESDTGTVWLAEDQTLEMRQVNDNLTAYFDIEEVKQFTKETFKEEQGNRSVIDFIMWTRKGRSFGVGFREKLLRDRLYEYIQKTQEETTKEDQENLGFGLFD